MLHVTPSSNTTEPTPDLRPRERLVLAVSIFHLCLIPWFKGGMPLWSQIFSSTLASLGFILALWPEDYGAADRFAAGKRLLRLPLFWLGIAVAFYAIIQALNPSWHFVRSGESWEMLPLDAITWLPSGVRCPFTENSVGSQFLLFAPAWLTACTLWLQLRRRKSLRFLLTALVINGSLLALVTVVFQSVGNGKILGLFEPSTGYTVATFPYKNHAGAFLNLLLGPCAALAIWYQDRARKEHRRNSPSPLFVLSVFLAGFAVALSFSRAATLLMLASLPVIVVIFLRHAYKHKLRLAKRWIFSGTVLILAVLFATAQGLRMEKSSERLNDLFTKDKFNSINSRQLSAQATLDMAQARWIRGWGAGSFRHIFPAYQKNYPAIFTPSWDQGKMFYWEHAHNEYLELWAELGLLGSLLIVGGVLGWLRLLIRARAWHNPYSLLLLLPLGLLAVHCWVDFNLHNPAVFLTASAFAVIGTRWAELERRTSPALSRAMPSRVES